jgi:hypothetical protein
MQLPAFACQKHLKTLSLSRDKTFIHCNGTVEGISLSGMGYRDESTHLKMTFYLYPWLPVENNRLSSVSMFKFEK